VSSLALAGVAVLAFVSMSSRPTDSSTPRSLRQITYGPDVQLGPTWSPDGRAIAFSSNRSGDFEIWVQALDQPEPVRLTWSEGADWQPSWSPDARLLVFRSERHGGGLYVTSPRGEGLRQVSSFGYRPRWSPDSAYVLFDSSQVERSRPQPYIVRVDGGAPQAAQIFYAPARAL
jgi:Tol biopolymer transport system component